MATKPKRATTKRNATKKATPIRKVKGGVRKVKGVVVRAAKKAAKRATKAKANVAKRIGTLVKKGARAVAKPKRAATKKATPRRRSAETREPKIREPKRKRRTIVRTPRATEQKANPPPMVMRDVPPDAQIAHEALVEKTAEERRFAALQSAREQRLANRMNRQPVAHNGVNHHMHQRHH